MSAKRPFRNVRSPGASCTTSCTTRLPPVCCATLLASGVRPSVVWTCSWRRPRNSSRDGPARDRRPASCERPPRGGWRSLSPMKITSLEAFKELAGRGTFVPVVKELVADLLTPVSAFLKIAENADYAFLLESVEGGEHVGRYSFLGKDPFLILRAHDGRTSIERSGTTTDSERPFIENLRELT